MGILMANQSPPPHPHHGGPSTGCAPQRTLIRFATLLGTFSINEDSNNGGETSSSNNNNAGDRENSSSPAASTNACIQSGIALRELLTPDPTDPTSISSFPSLSLDSAAHHHHPASEPRSKVEGLASSNLARPCVLVARGNNSLPTATAATATASAATDEAAEPSGCLVENDSEGDDNDDDDGDRDRQNNSRGSAPLPRHAFPISDASLIPSLLLANLSESFALLVDARLRAYGTILARHAASLVKAGAVPDDRDQQQHCGGDSEEGSSVDDGSAASCILATERKLSALIEIGEDVRMDGVVTALHVRSTADHDDGDDASQTNKKTGGDKDKEVVSMPLVFEAVIDVSVLNLVEGGRDRMTVNMKAPGAIAGYFDEGSDHTHLRSVHVHLDTHALLASMIDAACQVVCTAVDNVNASSKHQAALAAIPTAAELSSFGNGGQDADAGGIPSEVSGETTKVVEARGEDETEGSTMMPPPEPRAPPPAPAPAPPTASSEVGLVGGGGPLRYPIVSPHLGSTAPSGSGGGVEGMEEGSNAPTPLTLPDPTTGSSGPSPKKKQSGKKKRMRRSSSLVLLGGTEKSAAIVDYVMGEVDETMSWMCPTLAAAAGGNGNKRTKTAAAAAAAATARLEASSGAVYPLSA